RLISVKLHTIGGTALRSRPKIGSIPEHFTEVPHRLNYLPRTPRPHSLDLATTTVQIADHIAHKILRYHNLHLHNGLKQHRISSFTGIEKRHRAGDFKRHFIGVDVMKRPIDHRNPHITKRIPRNDSGIKPFFHTLFDRWNELSWNRAADSFVDELQSFARFSRLDR